MWWDVVGADGEGGVAVSHSAQNDATVEFEYEVWREHRKGGSDVCVGRGMCYESAKGLLAECDDPAIAAFASFYMVRATTTRTRVIPPEVFPVVDDWDGSTTTSATSPEVTP